MIIQQLVVCVCEHLHTCIVLISVFTSSALDQKDVTHIQPICCVQQVRDAGHWRACEEQTEEFGHVCQGLL